MDMPEDVATVPESAGRSYWVNGNHMTIRFPPAETSAPFSLVDVRARTGPPMHVHHAETEVFYVLEGRATFVGPDASHTVAPGGVVHVPPGTPHTFRVAGDTPARWLLVFQPSGFEAFFASIGQPASTTDPDEESTPEAVEEMQALAESFDLEFVDPPTA